MTSEERKERNRLCQERWRMANPEKKRELGRLYKQRDDIKAKDRAWHAAHADEVNARRRARYSELQLVKKAMRTEEAPEPPIEQL